jgi:hypothetical protein
MKKIVTLLMLFCLLISCERKRYHFSEEMIERLAFHEKNRWTENALNVYFF